MKSEEALEHLLRLHNELHHLAPRVESVEFHSWFARARSILTRAIGGDHDMTLRFKELSWLPAVYMDDMGSLYVEAFERSRVEAQGIIQAALAEVEIATDDVVVDDGSGVDPELWEHVATEVAAAAWGKVASQAVLFTEDRIRKWAGKSVNSFGKDLAIDVFGQSGDYRMGLTDGEKQGWQFVAQGIAQAVRNADLHRIQQRADHHRYALGVVGACSLLLTQMRYEHGNRFHDTSPASSGDEK